MKITLSSEKCINIVLFDTLVTLREPKNSKMLAKLMLRNLTRQEKTWKLTIYFFSVHHKNV